MIQEDFIEADEMGKCVEACEGVIGFIPFFSAGQDGGMVGTLAGVDRRDLSLSAA
jgi:hypothetical protein